ncbi:unnamed protein product [Gulo gulo]|uniref:Uncharacterized protein n=1 Tax=Gulo gulo TaxID=48420 RepID=A0A9X9MB69_GULGU|nr:unnamed protein product [Gulo gulo]
MPNSMIFWASCKQMHMDKYIVELLRFFTWKYGELGLFNIFAYFSVPANNLPLQML